MLPQPAVERWRQNKSIDLNVKYYRSAVGTAGSALWDELLCFARALLRRLLHRKDTTAARAKYMTIGTADAKTTIYHIADSSYDYLDDDRERQP